MRIAAVTALAAVFLCVDVAFACSTRSKAYSTAIKSDLRNLATLQGNFFNDHGRYTLALDSLEFRSSPGVEVRYIYLNDSGWAITATHSQLDDYRCYMVAGPPRGGLKPPSDLSPESPWCEGKLEPRNADGILAFGTWVFLVGLTIAARFFLVVPNRPNWLLRGLVAVTVVYTFSSPVLIGGCGGTPLALVLACGGLGAAFFSVALRRELAVR